MICLEQVIRLNTSIMLSPARKMKFPIKDFFSKCDQFRR